MLGVCCDVMLQVVAGAAASVGQIPKAQAYVGWRKSRGREQKTALGPLFVQNRANRPEKTASKPCDKGDRVWSTLTQIVESVSRVLGLEGWCWTLTWSTRCTRQARPCSSGKYDSRTQRPKGIKNQARTVHFLRRQGLAESRRRASSSTDDQWARCNHASSPKQIAAHLVPCEQDSVNTGRTRLTQMPKWRNFVSGAPPGGSVARLERLADNISRNGVTQAVDHIKAQDRSLILSEQALNFGRLSLQRICLAPALAGGCCDEDGGPSEGSARSTRMGRMSARWFGQRPSVPKVHRHLVCSSFGTHKTNTSARSSFPEAVLLRPKHHPSVGEAQVSD